MNLRQLKLVLFLLLSQLFIFVNLTAQDVFTEPFNDMMFVFVKGGCFEMGDTFKVGESDENPVHTVCLDDFYIGKYEVTQKQWIQLMEENPSAYPLGDDYPVEWVSWDETQTFLKRLNEKTKGSYRLPTEAEWEYACRSGGRQVKYGTKDGSINHSLANYGSGNWGEGDDKDGFEFTSPVGSFPPNAIGLHDMSGNVFEWVSDYKSLNYNYYAISPKNNPQGAEKSPRKVGRGGSWNFGEYHQRCSNRFSNWQEFHCLSYGFRIVKSP